MIAVIIISIFGTLGLLGCLAEQIRADKKAGLR